MAEKLESRQAWNFLDAGKTEEDRAILKRCKSPREALKYVERWYDPEREVASQTGYDKFHDITIPSQSNSFFAPHGPEDMDNIMD